MNSMITTFLKPYYWAHHKIDQTGMYRVVTLALVFLVGYSLFLSVVGLSAYSFVEQLMSLIAVVTAALFLNIVFAKLLRISANHESALITALILFFLFTPALDLAGQMYIALAAAAAIASKFILVRKKQHIFNAAAFGAAALSFTGWYEAWWWVASPEMFLPLLLAGVVVAHKVRKWPMISACVAAALIVFTYQTILSENFSLDGFERLLVTGPLLFLVFFMLTEPFTTPPRESLQIAYGALVGILMTTTVFSGWFAMTPELALVIANLALYPTMLGQKLYLRFVERIEIAADTFEYVFEKPAGMKFTAGQYLEWMLPHEQPDTRGLRRYFTIASAPEDADVRVALRMSNKQGSSYKKALAAMSTGESLIASQLAGDFVLPKDTTKKCGFIAGGIGVTPFVSFTRHMLQSEQSRDCILFYGNNFVKDAAYQELFATAEQAFGMKTVHILAKETHENCETGYISADILTKHVPDYKERMWYVSGPPIMVNAAKDILTKLGVARKNIITDFFPGLA